MVFNPKRELSRNVAFECEGVEVNGGAEVTEKADVGEGAEVEKAEMEDGAEIKEGGELCSEVALKSWKELLESNLACKKIKLP